MPPASGSAALRDIAAVTIGLTVFALFAHQSGWWAAPAVAGLLATAAAILWSRHDQTPTALLGLDSFGGRVALFSVVGAGLGLAGGEWHRYGLDLNLRMGGGIQPFVVAACAIGAAEELIYRGWVFGRAKTIAPSSAVVIAAIAHTMYKTALFAWPAVDAHPNLVEIACWTMGGGLVLGTLRAVSGSVMPAVAAHVVFDFVVYRSVGSAPWWVWK